MVSLVVHSLGLEISAFNPELIVNSDFRLPCAFLASLLCLILVGDKYRFRGVGYRRPSGWCF